MESSLSELPIVVLRQVIEYLPLEAAARLRATTPIFNRLIIQHFPQITNLFLLFATKHSVIRVLCGHLGSVEFTSIFSSDCGPRDRLVLDLQEGSPTDKLNKLAVALKNRLFFFLPASELGKIKQEAIELNNGLFLCKKELKRPKSYAVRAETASTSFQVIFEDLISLFHDLSFVLINCEVKDANGQFARVVEGSLRKNRITTRKLSFTMATPTAKTSEVSLPWKEMGSLKRFELATFKEEPSLHPDLTDEDLLNWDFDQLELNALTRVTPQGLHRLMDQFLNGNRKRTISLFIEERNPIGAVTDGFQKKDSNFPWLGFTRGDMQVEVRCLCEESAFITMRACPSK